MKFYRSEIARAILAEDLWRAMADTDPLFNAEDWYVYPSRSAAEAGPVVTDLADALSAGHSRRTAR